MSAEASSTLTVISEVAFRGEADPPPSDMRVSPLAERLAGMIHSTGIISVQHVDRQPTPEEEIPGILYFTLT